MGDTTRRRSSITSLLFAARTRVKAGLTIQLKRMTTIQWGQPERNVYVLRPIQRSRAGCRPHLASMRWPTCFSDTPRVIQSRPLRFRHTCRIQTWAITFRTTGELTDSLTANVGLRWEYFGRPVERDDRIASFDLATGQQVFPGQNGYPRSLVDPYYKDFAPRLGLAWRAGRSHDAARWLRDLLHAGCHQHVSATGVSGAVRRDQQLDGASRRSAESAAGVHGG